MAIFSHSKFPIPIPVPSHCNITPEPGTNYSTSQNEKQNPYLHITVQKKNYI